MSTPCGICRQQDCEGGTTAEAAVDCNPAGVRLHYVPDDRESEAGSRHPVVRSVTSKKLLKNAFLIFGRNAHAFIYDGDGNLRVAPTQFYAGSGG